jgi:hypothetical protein
MFHTSTIVLFSGDTAVWERLLHSWTTVPISAGGVGVAGESAIYDVHAAPVAIKVNRMTASWSVNLENVRFTIWSLSQ